MAQEKTLIELCWHQEKIDKAKPSTFLLQENIPQRYSQQVFTS
jgi:hypothetical protein